MVFIGLGCAGAMNVLALTSPAQILSNLSAKPALLRYGTPVSDPPCSENQCFRAGSETGVSVVQRPLPAFGAMPLYFEAASLNQGNSPAQFIARGVDCGFLISPANAQITLRGRASVLDCGGRRSATPLSGGDQFVKRLSRSQSGVTATALQDASESAIVQLQFVAANPRAQIRGADTLPGKINYLIGRDPADWRTGVAIFARVRVEQLYPGVNLVYYGNQRHLEYDFTIAPGANPNVIKIHFDGADKISIGAQGELILALGKDEIRQPAPVIYQMVDGQRQAISGGYRLVDADTVAFTVGNYNHKLPLVIDPVLSFSTYFGGSGSDSARSIALDTNGFIYIAGQTMSGGLATSNAFQKSFSGGSLSGDAFIAKFDNQGSNLIYFTYLGGSADDSAASIAVDGAGDVFVTGFTDSVNFPTTTNALYRSISGTSTSAGYFRDAFVTELNPGGSNLLYSTYLGGSGPDEGEGIALDSSNNIYVTGYTGSPDLQVSSNACQQHLGYTYSIYTTYLYANAFLAEIGASGTNLLYLSYLGGTNLDVGEGIAVDGSNYVYITGYTASTNFPTIHAIFQQFVRTNGVGTTNQVVVTNWVNGSLLNGSATPPANYDAFVAKFTPSCTNLVYSTLLGGTNDDEAYSIAADGSGDAYVTGWTVSTNFPNTVSLSNLYNGLANNAVYGYAVTTNVFLTQIVWNQNPTNAAIGNAAVDFSTVFGGTNFAGDMGYDVTLDPYGNVYVVGASSTTNFPAINTPGLLGTTNAGGNDVFVIAFTTNASSVIYSGYLGGSADDFGYGIAVDSSTNVYIAGQTFSGNFPTISPYQSSFKGGSDAFLAKIGWTDVQPEITDQSSLTNQFLEAKLQSVTYSITATGTPPLNYQWQVAGTNLIWTNVVNGENVTGATSNTLSISPSETNNTGTYRVVVTNYAGSAISSNAVLTVTAGPIITVQPTNQTVGVGSTTEFIVNGYVTSPYYIQWLKDGIDLTDGTNVSGSVISGSTNSGTLTINNVQTNDGGNYWLVITNDWGSATSSVANLTVDDFPIILAEPTNQTVGQGSIVTLTVNAIGAPTLGYQWQANGNNLLNSGRIVGVNSSALTITNVRTSDAKDYSVIVTNSLGSVTSSPPAVLTVLTAPLFGSIMDDTNGNLILSGIGNISGNTFYVLTSTNLGTPLIQWTPIATNFFGSQGQFVLTNAPFTNTTQQFYILQVPP